MTVHKNHFEYLTQNIFDFATIPIAMCGGPAVVVVGGCLKPQQRASVSQGQICSDSLTCCLTEKLEIQLSISPGHRPSSPSADPFTPAVWQGSHWSTSFSSHWYDSTWKNPHTRVAQAGIEHGSVGNRSLPLDPHHLMA